jgi:hypothetical protein
MAELGVPRGYRAAFGTLEALEDAAFDRLVTSLSSAPALSPVSTLVELAAPVFGDDRSLTARGLVQALLSAEGLIRLFGAEGEVARGISESADLDLDGEQRRKLQVRLEALLEVEGLRSTAAAVDLLTQNERNYGEARVFSDIRPIFGEAVVEAPTGAVIVETLQLRTWAKDGSSETIAVAMDESDLRELRDVLDRALTKTETLKSMLDRHGTQHFDLDERTK